MLKVYNNPLVRQYAVVILVNLSMIATGAGVVWPSPVLVKLSNNTESILAKPITEEEGSWIVSIPCIPSIAANFLFGFLIDIIGRKYSLILASLPNLVAGFIFIYTSEIWMLLFGRALVGISQAGILTFLPMYTSEIASKEIRGGLGSLFQIMGSCGVVLMFSVGPFISYKNLNITYTCINVLTIIPLFIVPDSPCFLYSRGRNEEALKVLTFFRGSESLAREELQEYESANTENVNKKAIFRNRLFLKTLATVVILGFGGQLLGFNAVSFYLQTILESCGTSVRPEIASVIIGLIQLCASFGTTFMTDRFGRKPIIIVTNIGMALGLFGLGFFFELKDNGPVKGFLNYVPLISLILFIYSYSTGMGSLFWVVSAELFDDKSRGIGMSIAIIFTALSIFLTTKYFPMMITAIGPAFTYWIFSINCVLLSLFVIFFIPETKGKSFAEIQNLLKNNSHVSIDETISTRL